MDTLRNYSFALALLILPLTGCAPLQQAPLVYGSKVSLGINVSGQTTEQPAGVSINIGYEQIDAAYVPVMVAKACDKMDDTKDLSHCRDTIYKLHNVTAACGDISSDKVKDLITNLRKAEHEREEADKKLKAAVMERTSAQDKDKKAGNDATQKEESLKALNAAKEKEKDAEAEKRAAYEKYERLWGDLNATKIKQDAYSVFGTFAADTQIGVGSSQGNTALKIGKVFSTGVASQNLTEGLQKYYQTAGGSQCLAAAKDFAAAYEKSLGPAKEEQKQNESKEEQKNSEQAKPNQSPPAQTATGKLTDEEKRKKVVEFYQMAVKACAAK